MYRAEVRGAGVLHAGHQGAAALPPGVPPRRRGAQHRVRQQAGQEHQTQVHPETITILFFLCIMTLCIYLNI